MMGTRKPGARAAFGLSFALCLGSLLGVALFGSASFAEESPPAASVKLDRKGLRVESGDGQFKFKIGGRLHADGTFHIGDQPNNDPENREATDGVELRRARLIAKATVYEDWHWVGEVDFADNETAIKDFYVTYSGFEGVTITGGHQKQPYSLALEMSSNDLPYTERSVDVDLVTAVLDRAIGVRADANGDHWFFAAGFYGDSVDAQTDNQPEGFGAAAKAVFAPIITSDQLVHIGFRGAYRRPEEDNEVASFKTETTHMSNYNTITTGDIENVDDIILFGPEAAFAFGPFSIFGEYNEAMLQRNGGNTLHFRGGHIGATWSLTGESRAASYAIKSGEFKMLKPRQNFSLRSGGCGAWELAVRYAYLDLSSDDVNGGEEQALTAAVNWYINPNVRLQFNYKHVLETDSAGPEFVVTKEGKGLNAFTTRLQFNF